MSKNWYPIINYDLCENCGACVKKCTHGVYDKKEHPTPKVIYKEGCVEGCTGCQNLCQSGAIKYSGQLKNDCGCNCNCGSGCC